MCVWRRISHDYIFLYIAVQIVSSSYMCGICWVYVVEVYLCVCICCCCCCLFSLLVLDLLLFLWCCMAILCVVRSQHLTEWFASTGIILILFCVCFFFRLTISPYDDEHTKTVSECPFKFVQPFGKCVFEAGPLTIYTESTLFVFPLFCVLLWKENKEREKKIDGYKCVILCGRFGREVMTSAIM